MLSKHSLPLTIILLTIVVGIAATYYFIKHTPSSTTPPNNTPPVTDNNEDKNTQENSNLFVSANGSLSFSYKKGWECREVLTNERVDCFPNERLGELSDGGFDMESVYMPEIAMFLENCQATLLSKDEIYDDANPFFYLKTFNGCRVLILSNNDNYNSVDKIEKIVF